MAIPNAADFPPTISKNTTEAKTTSKTLKPSRNPTFPRRLHFSTLPAVLRQCRRRAGLAEARQLHAYAFKNGAVLDPDVQEGLIRLYTRCRACRDARAVLAGCPDPGVVAQNDLIVVLCRAGDLWGAREVFDGMRERNVISWSVMIEGYAKRGEMQAAQELLEGMPKRNAFAWSSLLSGYLRAGDVEVARKIFDGMRSEKVERDVVTWTTMISGCVQNGWHKEALDLFLAMQEAGLRPNNITLVSILPAVSQLGALRQGQSIHAYIERTGIELDSNLGTALLDMYAKCWCIDEAVEVFEVLEHNGTSVWNSLIMGLTTHSRGRDALALFARMQEDPLVTPNEITFTGLLTACSHSGLVDEGREVFDLLTDFYQLTPNMLHYGCMIDLLEFLEKMPVKPNSVIWKILLSGCRVRKNHAMADEVRRRMQISVLKNEDD